VLKCVCINQDNFLSFVLKPQKGEREKRRKRDRVRSFYFTYSFRFVSPKKLEKKGKLMGTFDF